MCHNSMNSFMLFINVVNSRLADSIVACTSSVVHASSKFMQESDLLLEGHNFLGPLNYTVFTNFPFAREVAFGCPGAIINDGGTVDKGTEDHIMITPVIQANNNICTKAWNTADVSRDARKTPDLRQICHEV